MSYASLRLVSVCIALCIGLMLSPAPSFSAEAFYQPIADDQSSYGLKVLFIGNSILYVGETPQVLVSLIRSTNGSPSLKVAEVGGPNFTLQNHLEAGLAKRSIEQNGPWDYVIIQQQTSELVSSEPRTVESARALLAPVRARGQPFCFTRLPARNKANTM